jgi:hypothetical protein
VRRVRTLEQLDGGRQAPSQRRKERLFQRFKNDRDGHKARFLFLSPNGRRPETATNVFRELSYPNLAQLIREALERGADTDVTKRGREVVRDFLSTLAKELK